jgi:effector-binding domain-containing protein
MLKKILIVLLVIIGLGFAFLVYSGLFHDIKFQKGTVGPYYMVYEKHVGDYSKIGSVMDKVYKQLLNEDKIDTNLGFGIYFDDPQSVSKDKLRSVAGCILNEKDYEKIEKLKAKYKIKLLPSSEGTVTDFPYKNSFSVVIGVLKYYPALMEYYKNTKKKIQAPVIEFYDGKSNLIKYFVPENIDYKFFKSLL